MHPRTVNVVMHSAHKRSAHHGHIIVFIIQTAYSSFELGTPLEAFAAYFVVPTYIRGP